MEIDNLDAKILRELDLDARQSYSKIGKKLKKSKQMIAYRIKNLENKGIIKYYYIDINPRNLGYIVFNIFMQFQKINEEDSDRIFEYIIKSPNVGYCLKTIGNWDIYLAAITKNLSELHNLMNRLHNYLKGHLKKEAIIINIADHNYSFNYLNENYKFPIIEDIKSELNKKVYSPTIIEKKILKKLSESSLKSYLDLADELKVSYETVKSKIANLENRRVLNKSKAFILPEMIGYERYFFLIELRSLEKSKINKLIEFSKYHPNIIYLIESIGPWNIVMNVCVKNIEELEKIMIEIKEKYGELINVVEYLRIEKNIITYFNKKEFS